MTYTYGTKGAPAVGGGLPGLPRKAASSDMVIRASYSRIVIDSFSGEGEVHWDGQTGILIPPDGARFMRVAAIGGGGGEAARTNSTNNTNKGSCGGGGGACAATIIVPVSIIEFSIGRGGERGSGAYGSGTVNAGHGGDTLAEFGKYSLVGGGGRGGSIESTGVATTPVSGGGTASGGDFNFPGGQSSQRAYSGTGVGGGAGGGAAGPHGPGGGEYNTSGFSSAAGILPPLSEEGWGVGGGSGGRVDSSNVKPGVGSGGSVSIGSGTIKLTSPMPANNPWGRSNGEMGGGGSVRNATSVDGTEGGGCGGLVVEWFWMR